MLSFRTQAFCRTFLSLASWLDGSAGGLEMRNSPLRLALDRNLRPLGTVCIYIECMRHTATTAAGRLPCMSLRTYFRDKLCYASNTCRFYALYTNLQGTRTLKLRRVCHFNCAGDINGLSI